MILECCTDRIESVVNAVKGGASRLELCADLVIGGTTPSLAYFQGVRECLKEECPDHKVKLHVLIRPRFGDFCYSLYEKRMIQEQISAFSEAGADGVVIGALLPDGTLDQEVMQQWVQAAGNMHVTLHRAFDVCRDPFETLERAVRLGVGTILTSGQKDHCLDGIELLGKLKVQAAGRIDIMAGSHVDAAAVPALWREAGIRSFHMSGKKVLESRMQYRKEGVHMGLPCLSEYEIFETDEENVRAVRQAMEDENVFEGI